MTSGCKGRRGGDDGFSLLAVMIFVLVIVIAAMAFFLLSSYETKGALYRQASSEAFYLADGAIERARARFLDDMSWREGWNLEQAGRGTYDLSLADTALTDFGDVLRLVATGHVEQADRSVEVIAKLQPSALGLTMLIMGDADVNGNICVGGNVHVNGAADFGPNDAHLACGTYTDGYEITPPGIYTDPDHFPDATYYDVRATLEGGLVHARIFDRNGQDITQALGDSLAGVMSFNAGQSFFAYDFNKAGLLDHYFDDVHGVFKRDEGTTAVVVNFGGLPLGMTDGVCSLELDGPTGSPLNATLINARFVGSDLDPTERTQYGNWQGGLMTVKQLTWEPYYGIAAIAGDFQKQGSSQAMIGTAAWPALVYVTQDVETVNANFELHGSLICFGDLGSTGGPNISYDAGFLEHLPQYLLDAWQVEVSGTMNMLRWRELAGASD
jgi:hypothetical protein